MLRQAPTPTQRSVARSNEPSSVGERKVAFPESLALRGFGSRLGRCVHPQEWRRFSDGIVDAHGIGELAGIHAVVRIPERLEFAEGLDELGAEHLRQQRGARLAVAMLAGERAAEGEHDVGSAIDELAEFADAFGAAEVEIDARVHAALAVVAVERAAEAVLGHERGDGAQIVAELRGRNGGSLPSLPSGRARRARRPWRRERTRARARRTCASSGVQM